MSEDYEVVLSSSEDEMHGQPAENASEHSHSDEDMYDDYSSANEGGEEAVEPPANVLSYASAAVNSGEMEELQMEINELRRENKRYIRQFEDLNDQKLQAARLESKYADLKVQFDTINSEYKVKDQGYTKLLDGFCKQSEELNESKAAVAEYEKLKTKYSQQQEAHKQESQYHENVLKELRNELKTAYEQSAEYAAQSEASLERLKEAEMKGRNEALESVLVDKINGSMELVGDNDIWKKNYLALRKEMDEISVSLMAKEPQIKNLETEYLKSMQLVRELGEKIAKAETEKVQSDQQVHEAASKIVELQNFENTNQILLNDLRCQVIALLCDKQLNGNQLSAQERNELKNLRREINPSLEGALNSSGQVNLQREITDKSLLVTSVADLQAKNEELLMACRKLASILDESDSPETVIFRSVRDTSAEELNLAVSSLEKLKEKYLNVLSELKDLKAKVESQVPAPTNQSVTDLQSKVHSLEAKLQAQTLKMFEPIKPAASSASPHSEQLATQLGIANSRIEDLNLQLDQLRGHQQLMQSSIEQAQLNLGKAQERYETAEERLRAAQLDIENKNSLISSLHEERGALVQREKLYTAQIADLKGGIEDLEAKLESGHGDPDASQVLAGEQLQKLESLVNNYPGAELQAELQDVEEQLRTTTEQLSNSRHDLDDANRKLETLTESETKLKSQVEQLESQVNAEQQAKQDLKTEYDQLKSKTDDRIDELVEQVNDLEDSITEANQQTEKAKQEAEKAKQDSINELSAKLRTEITQELETTVKSELTANLQSQISSELTAKLEPEIKAQLTAKLEPEIKAHLSDQMETSTDSKPTPSEVSPSVDYPDLDLGTLTLNSTALELRKQLEQRADQAIISQFVSAVIDSAMPLISNLVNTKINSAIKDKESELQESIERRQSFKMKLMTQKYSKMEAELEKKLKEVNKSRESKEPKEDELQHIGYSAPASAESNSKDSFSSAAFNQTADSGKLFVSSSGSDTKPEDGSDRVDYQELKTPDPFPAPTEPPQLKLRDSPAYSPDSAYSPQHSDSKPESESEPKEPKEPEQEQQQQEQGQQQDEEKEQQQEQQQEHEPVESADPEEVDLTGNGDSAEPPAVDETNNNQIEDLTSEPQQQQQQQQPQPSLFGRPPSLDQTNRAGPPAPLNLNPSATAFTAFGQPNNQAKPNPFAATSSAFGSLQSPFSAGSPATFGTGMPLGSSNAFTSVFGQLGNTNSSQPNQTNETNQANNQPTANPFANPFKRQSDGENSESKKRRDSQSE